MRFVGSGDHKFCCVARGSDCWREREKKRIVWQCAAGILKYYHWVYIVYVLNDITFTVYGCCVHLLISVETRRRGGEDLKHSHHNCGSVGPRTEVEHHLHSPDQLSEFDGYSAVCRALSGILASCHSDTSVVP